MATRLGATGAILASLTACSAEAEKPAAPAPSADENATTSQQQELGIDPDLACSYKLLVYRLTHHRAPPLKIVTDGAFPPFSFTKDGKLVGWEVDYADAVMNLIGRRYTLEAKNWDGCCGRDPSNPEQGIPPADAPGSIFSDVYTGRADLAFAAISNGAVRKSVFPFSNRYGFTDASQQFQYRADRASSLNFTSGLSVLNGKRVAVLQGTNHYYYVTGQLVTNQHLGITVQPYATSHDAAIAVRDGAADYVFGFESEETTKELIANGTFVTDKAITTLDPAGLANVWGEGATYMFRPTIQSDERGLIDVVNCAIGKLTKHRMVDRLNEKWATGTGPSFVYCSPDETVAECDARD